MTMVVDAAAVSRVIREVAEAEILPRFRNLAAHQIREKKPGDLVTEADEQAELALTRRLTALLPHSTVVGEEAVAADASVLARLSGDAPVWIVDPVDGTANYANGRTTFAVIVALVERGRTRMGWIHDPLNNRTAIAELGQGAWIGDQRLAVAANAPLAQMAGTTGHTKARALAAEVAKLVNLGCAGHDYLDLVEGRLHFAYFRKLKPWDHAAGVLLHAEAGGFNALTDGTPYRPLPSDIGLLLAPNRDAWDRLRPLVP